MSLKMKKQFYVFFLTSLRIPGDCVCLEFLKHGFPIVQHFISCIAHEFAFSLQVIWKFYDCELCKTSSNNHRLCYVCNSNRTCLDLFSKKTTLSHYFLFYANCQSRMFQSELFSKVLLLEAKKLSNSIYLSGLLHFYTFQLPRIFQVVPTVS